MPFETKFPTLGDQDNSGAYSWTFPDRITADTGQVARAASSTAGAVSHHLRGTQFGFAIPVGATIDGIVAEVERLASAGAPKDTRVSLLKADVLQATNKASPNVWGALAVVSYGSAADLWGGAWTPTDINAAGFGFALSVEPTTSTNTRADVDFFRMTVHYTEGGVPGVATRYVSWIQDDF